MKMVYPGFIASILKQRCESAINKVSQAHIDQHQNNGMWGVHQLRVRLNGDPTPYRILICPADAPIFVGKTPIDQHFGEPING